MFRIPRPCTALLAALLLQAAFSADARPGHDHPPPPMGLPPGAALAPGLRDPGFVERGLSPEQAAREIQMRHGGRVLAVQPDGPGYRVKTLKDGEVRIYQVGP